MQGTYLDPAMFADLYHRGRDVVVGRGHGAATAGSGAPQGPGPGFSEDKERGGSQGGSAQVGPIIVRIVLAMEKETHMDVLDQWSGLEGEETREETDEVATTTMVEKERVYGALSEIQGYYVSFAKRNSATVKLCYVDPMRIQDTVDDLHSHLLEEITANFSPT